MLLLSTSACLAQNVEIKGYLGATYYQGDLAPLPLPLSFSEGNLAWALQVGMPLSKVFKLHVRYTLGKLAGDDANASTENRKMRNLSFQSPLREYALLTDVNLNHWLKYLDRYGINLYYTTGVAVFSFDPQAIRGQEIIKLQPLGTEGQGLPGYPDRYARTQISIPFGLGLSFDLGPRVKMGFEVVPRLTFTDYIDDVSSYYVNGQEFIDNNNPLAAIMSNRTGEYLGGANIDYPTGAMRGDPEDNDWYFVAGISLSYTFGTITESKLKVGPESTLEAPEE